MGGEAETKYMSLLRNVCHSCENRSQCLVVRVQEAAIRKYCEVCYQKLFASLCHACGSAIIPGKDNQKEVELNGKFWHTACFRCVTCDNAMANDVKPRFVKGRLQCSACETSPLTDRCAGCGRGFRTAEEKHCTKGRLWHSGCDCCSRCRAALDGKGHQRTDLGPVCATCHGQPSAAQSCSKCGQRNDDSSISWGEVTCHRACFTCTQCQQPLGDVRFLSRDRKPYCMRCYDALFSEQCVACKQPIDRHGGPFVRVQGRCWHKDCFVCTDCSSYLGSSGYYPYSGAIYCQECFIVENQGLNLAAHNVDSD